MLCVALARTVVVQCQAARRVATRKALYPSANQSPPQSPTEYPRVFNSPAIKVEYVAELSLLLTWRGKI